jgi:hypothetical protein
MELEGTIIDGQVRLDSPAPLPTGTRVRVALVTADTPLTNAEKVAAWKAQALKEREGKPPSTLAATLASLAGTVTDLPSDFAAQHDHYIHGTPKR